MVEHKQVHRAKKGSRTRPLPLALVFLLVVMAVASYKLLIMGDLARAIGEEIKKDGEVLVHAVLGESEFEPAFADLEDSTSLVEDQPGLSRAPASTAAGGNAGGDAAAAAPRGAQPKPEGQHAAAAKMASKQGQPAAAAAHKPKPAGGTVEHTHSGTAGASKPAAVTPGQPHPGKKAPAAAGKQGSSGAAAGAQPGRKAQPGKPIMNTEHHDRGGGPGAAHGSSHANPADSEEALIRQYNLTITRRWVQQRAQKGIFMVAIADNHFADFALNWAHYVRAAGITGYALAAMDDAILRTLAKQRYNTFSLRSGPPREKVLWGTPAFAKAQHAKIRMISKFLDLGVQVLVSDCDVVWLRNPIPFLAHNPEPDLLISTDWPLTTVGNKEKLEDWADWNGAHLNVGIMLFRAPAQRFLKKWSAVIEADDKMWEQHALINLVYAGRMHPPNRSYFLGFNGTLKVGVLPVPLFAGGHVYFTQRMHEQLKVTPYAVHTTFTFSSTDGKRNRFREELLWQVDPQEYYMPKGGLLVYEPHIPEQLLQHSFPWQCKENPPLEQSVLHPNNTVGHFNLVNHQLKQLRNALAIATILNRTLVLPQLTCGIDQFWNPHNGCMPPSVFKLPFKCPADHLLELQFGWQKVFEEAEFGPHIDFRERSFLRNPKLHPAVLASAVSVTPCKPDKPPAVCSDGRGPATVHKDHIVLRSGLDSDKIRMALSSVSTVALLKFTSMDGAFGNFSSPEQYKKFFKRLQHYGTTWGQVAHKPEQPGSIRYDFWWDIPHTDWAGRKFDHWEIKLI